MRNKVLKGDCYKTLKTLPENSVDCIVTSPPYFNLRDYGLPKTKWPEFQLKIMYGYPPITIPAMECCLGLEPDPLQFVAHLVMIFEECKRVLAPWGTCWINMGDTYATNAQTLDKSFGNPEFNVGRPSRDATSIPKKKVPQGLKRKDMIGIPWMMAFALRSHGWYLRSDVIWNKPNAMPESVKDRPTKAHEYFFLLAKSEHYYYDSDAIREAPLPQSVARQKRAKSAKHKNATPPPGQSLQTFNRPRPNVNKRRSLLEVLDEGQGLHPLGSNKRTIWSVPTIGIPDAHFAIYPEELITPCIKAGTSQHGNCDECGKPYKRGKKGWEKPCSCSTDKVRRPLVLDPFGGSGTTGIVAQSHGCDYVVCELSDQYIPILLQRFRKSLGMFA